MTMDFRFVPQSEGLKPAWKAALEDIVEKYKRGVEVKWGAHDLRTTRALMNRHYVEEYSEVRTAQAGYKYVQYLLRPTKKALALDREVER